MPSNYRTKKQLINKKEATELFGNQKDQSFAGILGNIMQSFGGKYLYKSIEEQASHLLYFVIKNHPFSDGNKRIGAFLFIWFLEKNKHSLKKSGELKLTTITDFDDLLEPEFLAQEIIEHLESGLNSFKSIVNKI